VVHGSRSLPIRRCTGDTPLGTLRCQRYWRSLSHAFRFSSTGGGHFSIESTTRVLVFKKKKRKKERKRETGENTKTFMPEHKTRKVANQHLSERNLGGRNHSFSLDIADLHPGGNVESGKPELSPNIRERERRKLPRDRKFIHLTIPYFFSSVIPYPRGGAVVLISPSSKPNSHRYYDRLIQPPQSQANPPSYKCHHGEPFSRS